ncbi:MAG: 5-methylcytosine restriction system specificity protein McrC, partial [Syntrophales bacterium]
MDKNGTPLRLCEWSSVERVCLTPEQRRNIDEAVNSWKKSNNLPEPPLWFSGPKGDTLNSRQYVGVIELSDIVIEIFPKLDKKLLDRNQIEDDEIADSVMSDLLWLLEVSSNLGIIETDTAGIKESPTNFYDVFALLMAKHLLVEINLGVSHKYVTVSDDIRRVRGKICLLDQVTRNLNRLDKISCEWDEFTPDIPMNQLLKCSCVFLSSRVRDAGASRALIDCITHLDDICDVDPITALTGVIGHRWDRTTDRFRPVFDLAKRLLQGVG